MKSIKEALRLTVFKNKNNLEEHDGYYWIIPGQKWEIDGKTYYPLVHRGDNGYDLLVDEIGRNYFWLSWHRHSSKSELKKVEDDFNIFDWLGTTDCAASMWVEFINITPRGYRELHYIKDSGIIAYTEDPEFEDKSKGHLYNNISRSRISRNGLIDIEHLCMSVDNESLNKEIRIIKSGRAKNKNNLQDVD